MQRSIRQGLLFAAVLIAVPVSSLASERVDGGAWSRRVMEGRASVGAATNQAEALKVRWRELAAEFPVFTDWILQDAGRDAEALLVASRATAVEAALVAKVAGDLDRAGAKSSHPRIGDVLADYVALATERRRLRIGALLCDHAPFAFTEGHTFRMSFIGYTEGLSDARNERFFKPGARLATLEFPRGDLFGARRTLLDDPYGMMRDVDASFDRERLLFAWKKSDRLDDYHLHEVRLSDGRLRQLTTGLGRADYEPIYLPDGDIVFTSTRPEQSVPCWWTEISNLYRMDGQGRHARRLAVDQVHALYPQLMADGRITYTRWDYNDRGQVYPHPVFSMRPDGQDQRAFYGANSWFPNSLLHTRGIPGSHKAMSIAAGHHTLQQGKLVILDQQKGRDEGPGLEFIAPRRVVPYERKDQAMQQGDLFRYPYPLSETELLVSYKPEWGVERFGLYWMNADGARELLHADGQLDVARMVALGQPRRIAKLPDAVDYAKSNGTYYVHDVYRGIGLEGIERGTAKKIRVVELDYRAAGVGMTLNGGEGGGSLNSAPVAIANGTWDVKRILGDADIHADGSALFEVPAMASIYLQVLDAKGRVIQTTRTWDTLRPGEQKGCMGCHDKSVGNFYPYKKEDTIAWRSPPQKLQPFHGPARGFSFAREVQPILDAKCVRCHDGSKPEAMDLRGVVADATNMNLRAWTKSYLNLTQAERKKDGNYRKDVTEQGLVSWISKMSRPTEIPPYFAGAAKSRLLTLLENGHHDARLETAEYEKLAAWMDLLVPFSGDYREGNTWTAKQMAYYDYYEGKRRAQAAEEHDAVATYISRAASQPTSEPAPFTRARYRAVIADLKAGEITNQTPAFIDRIRVRADASSAGQSFVLKNARTGKVLASLRPDPQTRTADAKLAEPVRTDAFRIETETGAAVSTTLHIEYALGVLVSEVPAINGFHPFLDVAAH